MRTTCGAILAAAMAVASTGMARPVQAPAPTERLAETRAKIEKAHAVKAVDKFFGFDRIVFDFDGHDAWVVCPKGEARQGKPWTWTMQWADSFVPRTNVPQMLSDGFHHATIDTFRHRMDEDGLKVSAAFQKFLVEELGFAPKVYLIGMSWGGFFSTRYAANYPQNVAKIYLDAPLLCFKDTNQDIGPWTGKMPDGGWETSPEMPLNMAERLAATKIPVLLLYGGVDAVVPPAGNCEPFAERFKAAGGDITVVRRGLYAHHPHGVEVDETMITDFFCSAGHSSCARPVPSHALAARLAEGPEVIGIVHWGLNTYTDREWGYGNEDPALLDPTDFSADQIVGACKAGGIGGLVVVAKHHDGFCLWPTKTTEHNITKSPFWKSWSPKLELEKEKTPLSNSNSKLELKREAGRDYVKEMSEACRRAGLKFGVYCSPWDRNNAAYATSDYVKTYHAQVEELNDGRYGDIFEMWFDGANGGDGYYGGAWENRSIGKAHDYYQFEKLWDRVEALQPDVCFFGGRNGFAWPGNESGIVPPESGGTRDDGTFRVYEADFPLRPGWFYHKSQDGYSRSGEFLMKIYLRTVGNGATMDIGIAPDRRGRLTDEDAACLSRFSEIRREFFSKPVADASSQFNVILMKEDISRGERVDEWRVILDGRELARGGKIGTKRIRVLDSPVRGKELRLEVVKGDSKADEITMELFAADEELVRKVMSSVEPRRPPSPFERKGVMTSRTGDTLVFMMKNANDVSSLLLTPDADALDGTPVAFCLAFSVDGVNWQADGAEYRLDNVAANPIPQTVDLGRKIKVKYLRLKAVRTLRENAPVSLKGLDFTDDAARP